MLSGFRVGRRLCETYVAFQVRLVSDCIEPLDLLVDVVLALDPFELQLVGLERVLESVPVDCLG